MASTFSHLKIPLEEIKRATNNFSDDNIIGKGGFGNVYKGQVTHCGEPTNIAARRLDRRHGQGNVEFWTEITVLSSLHHENIVDFIGYVDEEDEQIIVNRHYAKGSLAMYLSDPTLTWVLRLYISVCLGDAINYIHRGMEQKHYIIHRNLNSLTILLNDFFIPKLSGFEYSIKHPLEKRDQIFLCDKVIGTKGYMDPADLKNGGVTHKSDIYSFGIVLFELMCGRKAFDQNNELLLASLAKFHYRKGTLHDIIAPDLWNQMDPESFKCFSEAAYSCLEKKRSQRPNVEQVFDKLKKAFKFQSIYEIKKAEDEENEKDMKNIEDESDTDDDEEEDKRYEEELSLHKRIRCLHIRTLFGLRNAPRSPRENIEKVLNNVKHLRIRLNDIEMATENFSEKYMIGTQRSRYKTELEWKNNRKLPKRRCTVKIKHIRFPRDKVYNEIEILSHCKHDNIENLVGYCKKGRGMILVYEYVSSQRLRYYLERDVLTWDKRLKICLHIAHGLNYLHHEMEGQKTVIHCDINVDNIKLDADWKAKVIGFGESIYLPSNQDDDALYHNAPRRFKYYIDPEYIQTGKLKRESDVYSFGVVMFEILCGMSSQSELSNNKRPDVLVREWLHEGIINRKVSPVLKGENGENNFMLNKGPNKDSLDTYVNIASQCFAEKQNLRPTMKVIIKELEKALSFQENNKDILRMSLEDIKLATKDFNSTNEIGRGGFGMVYKGEVAEKDGNHGYTIVAKKLDTSHGQGKKQFYNELQILYAYKHVNIIGLIGYSNETNEKIIVYEHAPKGSLDNYLSDISLTWKSRLKICIDFATGLDFLHGGGHEQEVVIHRDIKASNILLFDDWKAKIGDFGLSVTVNKETGYTIDHACGTKGYLDPSYKKSGFLTLESDIYSFGVVLFEIMCGKTAFAIQQANGQYLPSFIKQIFKERKQDEVVFHAIKDEVVPKSLITFQNIACRCLDGDRGKRPSSKEVLAHLKKALEIQELFNSLIM